jgi:hypothetical protein
MLTPQNLTLNHPAIAPLLDAAPRQEVSLFPPLACLFSEALFAAPTDEDEEDDEDDPEEAEDDLDDQEDEEDDDDEDDEEDDEDNRIPDPGEEEEDEDEDDEDEDDEDEEDDEEEDGSSESFFLQPSRSMPRNRTIQ